VLGVTKSAGQRDVEVTFWVDDKNAPYVITKPLHHTQKILKVTVDGTIFSIKVVMNFELERELLGFGPKMKVLGPRILVKQMKDLYRKSLEHYTGDSPIPQGRNLSSLLNS
jgi:predicted DNA-binding transcriptional regulator YafY